MTEPTKDEKESKGILRGLLLGGAIVAVFFVYAIGKDNERTREAQDRGKMQACMYFETDINDRPYDEAVAKCEYELEYGD